MQDFRINDEKDNLNHREVMKFVYKDPIRNNMYLTIKIHDYQVQGVLQHWVGVKLNIYGSEPSITGYFQSDISSENYKSVNELFLKEIADAFGNFKAKDGVYDHLLQVYKFVNEHKVSDHGQLFSNIDRAKLEVENTVKEALFQAVEPRTQNTCSIL